MTGSEPISLYEFAEFRLDPRRRLLGRKTGESVELTGKAFDALLYLSSVRARSCRAAIF